MAPPIWAARYAEPTATPQSEGYHQSPITVFAPPPPIHEIRRKAIDANRGVGSPAREANPATRVFTAQPNTIQRQLVVDGPPRTRRVRDTRDATGQIMELVSRERNEATVRKSAGDLQHGWHTARYIYNEDTRQYTQRADPRMVWAPDLNVQLERQGDFYKHESQQMFQYDRSTFRYVPIYPLGDNATFLRRLKDDLFVDLGGANFYRSVRNVGFRLIAREPGDEGTTSMTLRNGGRLAPTQRANNFNYVTEPDEAIDAAIWGWLERYTVLSDQEDDISKRDLYDRAHTVATDIYDNLPSSDEDEGSSMEEGDENEEFRGVIDDTGMLQAAAWIEWDVNGGAHVEYIVGSPDNLIGVDRAKGAPSTLMQMILEEAKAIDTDNTLSLDALPGTVASYVKMGFEENGLG